jgi:hypothetical protein
MPSIKSAGAAILGLLLALGIAMTVVQVKMHLKHQHTGDGTARTVIERHAGSSTRVTTVNHVHKTVAEADRKHKLSAKPPQATPEKAPTHVKAHRDDAEPVKRVSKPVAKKAKQAKPAKKEERASTPQHRGTPHEHSSPAIQHSQSKRSPALAAPARAPKPALEAFDQIIKDEGRPLRQPVLSRATGPIPPHVDAPTEVALEVSTSATAKPTPVVVARAEPAVKPPLLTQSDQMQMSPKQILDWAAAHAKSPSARAAVMKARKAIQRMRGESHAVTALSQHTDKTMAQVTQTPVAPATTFAAVSPLPTESPETLLQSASTITGRIAPVHTAAEIELRKLVVAPQVRQLVQPRRVVAPLVDPYSSVDQASPVAFVEETAAAGAMQQPPANPPVAVTGAILTKAQEARMSPAQILSWASKNAHTTAVRLAIRRARQAIRAMHQKSQQASRGAMQAGMAANSLVAPASVLHAVHVQP